MLCEDDFKNNIYKRQDELRKELNKNSSTYLFHDYHMYYNLLYYCFNENRFSLDRFFCNLKVNSLSKKNNLYQEKSYLDFLKEIKRNVSESFDNISFPIGELKKINDSNLDFFSLSSSFYEKYGLKEIYEGMSNDNIFFCDNYYGKERGSYGLHFNILTSKQSYITIRKTGTLMDFQSFNHEFMHAIDFKLNPKYPNNYNFNFIEMMTDLIDFLFLDFLENNADYKDKVKVLKSKKINRVKKILFEIDSLINFKHDEKKVIAKLMELESFLVSYTMYCKSKEKDFNDKIKSLSCEKLPISLKPDFESVGISDDDIIDVSKNIKNYVYENKLKIIKI